MEMLCLDRGGNQIDVPYVVVRDPDYLDYKLYKRRANGEYQLKRICGNYDEAVARVMFIDSDRARAVK